MTVVAEQSNKTEPRRLREKIIAFGKTLVPKFLDLVTLSALLTGAGFFVVHSYIATFTSLFTFNISVIQYLSAGVNLFLALIWNIILPIILGAIVTAGILIAIALVWQFAVRKVKLLQQLVDRIKRGTRPILDRFHLLFVIVRLIWRLYQFIAWLLFLALLIASSVLYGANNYSQSPRMVGGGMPTSVILIFKEAQDNLSALYPVDPLNKRQSQPLDLLIELTDGVILREPQSHRVLIVKNDVIQSIIDLGSPYLIIATPIPTATATSTLNP